MLLRDRALYGEAMVFISDTTPRTPNKQIKQLKRKHKRVVAGGIIQ